MSVRFVFFVAAAFAAACSRPPAAAPAPADGAGVTSTTVSSTSVSSNAAASEVAASGAVPGAASRAAAAAAHDAPANFAWPAAGTADVAFKWSVKRRTATEAEVRCRWFWYLWRSESVVETLESHGNTGEAWRRSRTGEVTGYERLFHVDRKLIEYVPGDLAAVGAAPDWTRLASVVDPSQIGTALTKRGEDVFAGVPVEIWSGESGGVTLEVRWCPEWAVPVRIVRTQGGEILEFDLRDARAAGATPWSRPKSGRYDRVDFADIGDRTTDPFFRRLIANGGVPGSVCTH